MANGDTDDYAISGATGALSGAAMGSAVLPGVGTAIGAGVGLVAGLLGEKGNKDEKERQERIRKKARRDEKNAAARLKSAQRREKSEASERRARAAKDASDLPGVRFSPADAVLASSIGVGGGTPYDQYMSRTYGKQTVG
tara:strand:+ start:1210 stop:1629 length:420 start_codon:yes stop_codon:yes gene_type:complete